MPFDDDYFDVICSFSSIDHVKDLGKTTTEIYRVLKPNGTFLLLIDIYEHPTVCEPQTITWNFMPTHPPDFNTQ